MSAWYPSLIPKQHGKRESGLHIYDQSQYTYTSKGHVVWATAYRHLRIWYYCVGNAKRLEQKLKDLGNMLTQH